MKTANRTKKISNRVKNADWVIIRAKEGMRELSKFRTDRFGKKRLVYYTKVQLGD